MASKKTKAAPTDEELQKMLDGLGEEELAAPPPKTTSKFKAPSRSQTAENLEAEVDPLADLEKLTAPQPDARPRTPRIGTPTGNKGSPGKLRTSTTTPPPAVSGRTSEDRATSRRSGESTRSFHNAFTPSASSTEANEMSEKLPHVAEESTPVQAPVPKPAASSGGSWWGSLTSVASAVVKTAEGAVKEIQQNEEAKRWAEQVKGNVGVLRGLGGDLTSRALPTFTTLLSHIAPPISAHERLAIHITHDLLAYPSLDPLIYQTFSRVMSQVEGGELVVLQRGHENKHGRPRGASNAGWSDGPWWRQMDTRRDLGTVKGLTEGTKLCRASAEAFANEYFASHGGIEAAAQRATEDLSETNPVRSSDIFLAVQPVTYTVPSDLFAAAPRDTKDDVVPEKASTDEVVAFAFFLTDPVHSITFSTVSQSVPSKWISWLDAPAQPPSNEQEAWSQLPEEIAEIVEGGGVDPREWVSEWLEETISLAVGVVAQRYVARRMGVGEGGMKGKARAEVVNEQGGGEAARAGLI